MQFAHEQVLPIFGLLPLGDVEHRSNDPNRSMVLVTENVGTVKHRREAAVGALEAILVGPARSTALYHAANAFDDTRLIAWVNSPVPPVRCALQVGIAEAVPNG